MVTGRFLGAVLVGWGGFAGCPDAVASSAGSAFARCDEQAAAAPASRASSLCFYEVARRFSRWDEGAAWLEDFRRRHPGVHWATLHLAYVEWGRGSDRVEGLLREAADGFSEQGELSGEVSARANLLSLLERHGKSREAGQQAERVRELGEQALDPETRIKAWTAYARHLAHYLEELRRAHRILTRAEAVGVEPLSYWTKSRLFRAISTVSQSLGRLNEATRYLRRLEELAQERGDERGVVFARVERAEVMLEELEALPRDPVRQRALAFVEETVRRTVRLKDRPQESRARWQAALLSLRDPRTAGTAREHLERCITLAKETHTEMDRINCLGRLALVLAPSDPTAASALMEEAMAGASRQDNARRSAEAWRARVELAWRLRPSPEAIAVALDGLDTIEVIRSLQAPGSGRIGAFSRWTSDYYGLAGRLLRQGESPGGTDRRALAFEVMERMRARGLLDEIEATRHRSADRETHPAMRARKEALEAIARIQRMLVDPTLSPERRAALRSDLEQQELRAEELREELWKTSGGEDRYRPPVFATVDQVRAELAEDEAMLLYQLGLSTNLTGHFGGGAWVWVVTKSGAAVHGVPDRLELEDKIQAFLGLVLERGVSISPAARSLYQDLVAQALKRLPPHVRRLIIVPDGRLHALPFAALEAPDGVPLAATYALSSVPSATFWLEWRRGSAPSAGEQPVLAFVDPETSSERDDTERAAWEGFPLQLGRLPNAREEGRTAVAYLGGGSRLRAGPEATEAAFKRDVREPYRLIHFGAHAVIDDVSPERSAVVLTAGGEQEDGLLQAREIVDLDLARRIVVLAACRSAGGKMARGEGVLSLSRAFLAAGAHAVVGSRWPLRDDDARRIFDVFYRELGRGRGLSESIGRAQREVLAEGHPPAAWAGLVVLGNGSLTPFPAGGSRHRGVFWARAVAGALLVLLVVGVVLRRRRPRAR